MEVCATLHVQPAENAIINHRFQSEEKKKKKKGEKWRLKYLNLKENAKNIRRTVIILALHGKKNKLFQGNLEKTKRIFFFPLLNEAATWPLTLAFSMEF